MTHALRPISHGPIPRALEKAEWYRLLNEPRLAESICHDVLAVEPEDQPALIMLVLTLSDQSRASASIAHTEARDAVSRLKGEYERIYYADNVSERRAKAYLDAPTPSSAYAAYDYLEQAMEHYDRAQALEPPGVDDAVLRWNTCVRLIERHHLGPAPDDAGEQSLE